MSYSLQTTFLLVILPILLSALYVKRWYKVLEKRKDRIGKTKEKRGIHSSVRLECVQGTILCCKFSCSVEGCDASGGWQYLPDVRQVTAIEIFFALKKITVFSWRGSKLG